MKYLFLLCLINFIYTNSFAQFVGINTTTPVAMLHVSDSNVLFTGPNPFVNYAPAANPPVQGPGTRVMWYAQKGAFRAGWVEDNQWDKDSIGIFSVALGHSVLASYTGSVAMGIRTKSRNFASTALGYNTQANGDYSLAAGYESKANAQIATAIGASNTASGFFSTAIGSNNLSSGTSAVAIGESAIASGTEAIAIGSHVKAKSRASFVTGWYNDTTDFPDPVFVNPADRIFQLGNGNGFLGTYTNALTVLRNGNHGLGTLYPMARLHVADSNVLFTGPNNVLAATLYNPPIQGPGARMMWYPQKAAFRAGLAFGNQWDKDSIGVISVALGNSTKAKGESSFAAGAGSNATGIRSTAMGDFSTALGNASTAIGFQTKATGDFSTSFGGLNNSLGQYSFTAGSSNNANGFAAIALGQGSTAGSNTAIAMGIVANATGFSSLAIGQNVTASAQNSVALGNGTISSGLNSFSSGAGSSATGDISFAAGDNVIAKARAATSFGRFNDNQDTPNASFEASSDRVFQIGTGVDNGNRKNALTILRNGNIGIGNILPDAPLSFVNGYGHKIALFSSGVNAQYGFGVQGSLLQIYADASNSDIAFGYGGSTSFTERVRIKGNGNVGIGNTNPVKPLSFPSTLGEKILLYPGGAGEVGIGVYGNELRLHSDNPGSMVSFGTQDNAGVFTQAGRFQISAPYALYVNGSIWANGTTYASDARFKEDINSISSPLQKLLQINGVEYKMKAGSFPNNNFSNQRQIGLLAQNVEKIIPEAVNEIDGYKGVDYARLVPLLIESIKEQQKQIEELKLIIKSIEKK